MSVTTTINGKKITFDLEVLGGSVALKATHIDGVEMEAGYLLSVTGEGKYQRFDGVNLNFPFKLSKSEGKIKQEKGVF
jgi:hypothetical protein